MHHLLRSLFVVLVAVGSLLAPPAASAQDPSGAFQGLFAEPRSDANARERLDLTVSFAGAFDSDLPFELRPFLSASDLDNPAGYSAMLLGGADYLRRGRLQVGASVNSALRYDPGLDSIRAVGHSAAATLSAPVTRRMTLDLLQTASYSPSYLYGLLPANPSVTGGELPPLSPDYTSSESDSYSFGTTASLGRAIGRRGRLAFSGDIQYSDYPDGDGGRREMTVSSAGGEYSQPVSRNLRWRAEYRYRTGEFGFVDLTTSEHAVDVELVYDRPLSATRRLALGVSGGSSTIGVPEFVFFDGTPQAPARRYTALGEVYLTYTFARTWQARATVNRGLQYVAQFSEPLVAHSASAGLMSLATRRLELSTYAAYSSGASSWNIESRGLKTYTGTVRVQYALTRSTAVYAEGYSYFYEMGNAASLLNLSRRLERNGARAGVTLWVPAFRRRG